MGLSKEEIKQFKEEIIQQIESTFPEEKKSSIIEEINSMNEQQFEEFLVKKNLIKDSGEGGQCIFCSIASGKSHTHKVGESQNAVAVLELNPLSRGHTIIIPKNHVQATSEEIEIFAKEIKEKIRILLKTKDVLIEHGQMFNHAIINIIPVYDDEKLSLNRKQASAKELEEIQKLLTEKIVKMKKEKIIKPKKEKISDKNHWLPKRIP